MLSIAFMVVAVLRRRKIASAYSLLITKSQSLLPANRFDRLGIVAVAALLVIYALAPPRDGDVMRYHLTHIRQIASEGSWTWIPDVHYAVPFAWAFNYLPFEIARVPQGAALLNALLWVVVFFVVLESSSRTGSRPYQYLVCLCFMSHPFVVKIFSAAFSDGYAILVTTVLAIGLSRLRDLSHRDLALLGFVCWIGIASRYQVLPIAGVGSLIAIGVLSHARNWRGLGFFTIGAVAAIAASSPFYLMNWAHTGNPVWPLSIPFASTDGSFIQQLGASFARPFSWPPTAPLTLEVKRLFMEKLIAPLPVVLTIVSVVTLFVRRNPMRAASLLSCGFLVLWLRASPRLYPTHISPIIALGPLLVTSISVRRDKIASVALRLVSIAFISLSFFFSLDYLRYDITGNEREFHRYTWYYGVYDWVNHHTSPESRMLVVVRSGLTYYLERPYRRADPWLSGEIDWSRTRSPAALDSVMNRGRFEYLIYDDQSWDGYPGGQIMSDVVHSAVSHGFLVPVHHSPEKLYSSRVTRTYTTSNVYVYKRTAKYSFSGPP
jgi:hypothetical protein